MDTLAMKLLKGESVIMTHNHRNVYALTFVKYIVD